MPVVNYLWNPINDNIVREFDDDGNTIADYTTESRLHGDVISQHRDGKSYVYHYDGQGNTLALTDEDGDVTDTYAYNAFGEVISRTGTTVNPFQFGGQFGLYRDEETGEYNSPARPYSPPLGRWLNPGVVTLPNGVASNYVFFQNNPTSAGSPYGMYGPIIIGMAELGIGRQFTCEEFKKLFYDNKTFFEDFPGNTSFKEIYASHVDLYCGKCQGFGGGYTWRDGGTPEWCHICLTDSTLHDLTYWIGRLVHEGKHFLQIQKFCRRTKDFPGAQSGAQAGGECQAHREGLRKLPHDREGDV